MFDRLNLAVRLRDPWESVDLGFILVRTHWKAVMGAWLALALPLGALLIAIFRNHLWVPPLLLWWLNPALDRVVLHVLSKATFGDVPTVWSTLRSLPAMMRHGWFANLFWRRLSPHRSFVLAVWQLEEQTGEGYRQRCSILLRKGRIQAIFLTVIFFLFHGVFAASVLAAFSLFSPQGSDFQLMDAVFGSGSDRVRWVDFLLSALPMASTALFEPFYVGGGFALYLNRRVELEGWDLEMAFRRMAARFVKVLGRGVAILLLLGCLQASAQPTPRPTPEEALADVLKQPEFQAKQKKKGLHWKQKDKKPDEAKDINLPPGLMEALKALAVAAKWLVIAAAAGVLLVLLWRYRSALARRLSITSREELPETLFGMDIRPEALPKGLDGVAADLWAKGDVRGALALLYRGALAHLVHHYRTPIPKGATEGDCMRKAQTTLTEEASDFFGRLTQTWLQIAYADMPPAPGSESLCREWARHFQSRAEGGVR